MMAAAVPAPLAGQAAPVPAPSALTVSFSVPDFTTGAAATRLARTAAARAPRFEVTLNERLPAVRVALPQLGWANVAATGSSTALHALLIALGPLLAPSAPLALCDIDGYFAAASFELALRALEDADDFVFPSSPCHMVHFWKLLAGWLVDNSLIPVDPADFLPLDAIAPRLAHPHSFAHDLSSDHIVQRGGGSLLLWSLFTALVGAPGAPTARMSPTSNFMRVVNRIVRFILADASSEAAQLVAEGG